MRVFAALSLLLTVLAASSCRTVGPSANQVRDSQLLVENRLGLACDIWAASQDAGSFYAHTVPSWTKLLIRHMPAGEYTVNVSCGPAGSEQRHEFRVTPSRQAVSTISLGAGDGVLVDRTATLKVVNESESHVEVSVESAVLGQVPPASTALFHDVPVGNIAVQARALPAGTAFSNTLVLQSERYTEFVVSEASMSGNIREHKEPAGDLVIENRLAEAVSLHVNGQEHGEVAINEARRLAAVRAGSVQVEVSLKSGRRLTRTLSVPDSGSVTWVVSFENAELSLVNLVGEQIVVYRDNSPWVRLDPGQEAVVPVEPGPVQLGVWCPASRHMESRSVTAQAGIRVPVRLGPQGGRLLLSNPTDEPQRVFRNSRFLATLPPGATVEFGGQPLGTNLIEAVGNDGTLVARQEVSVGRLGAEPQVAVSLKPDLVRLTVQNSSGEPLRLSAELGAKVIPPDGRIELDWNRQWKVFKSIGVKSLLRYDASVSVPPGVSEYSLSIASQVGGVVVRNAARDPATVWIDGRSLGQVGPGDQTTFMNISPGRHRIEARQQTDESQVLKNNAFMLAPGGWYTWEIQSAANAPMVANRSGEPQEISVNGQQAGSLPAGTQTRIPPLSEKTRVDARGDASATTTRFSVDSNAGPAQLSVYGVSSSLAISGLAGREAVIEVDGTLFPIQAGTPEPAILETSAGEHRVVVRMGSRILSDQLVVTSPGMLVYVNADYDLVIIDVTNETMSEVTVTLDSTVVGRIPPQGQLAVEVQPSRSPELSVQKTDGSRLWLLKGVPLPDSGRFGWRIAE